MSNFKNANEENLFVSGDKLNLQSVIEMDGSDCINETDSSVNGVSRTSEYTRFTENLLNRFGMKDYVTLSEYRKDSSLPRIKIPDISGVYIVVYPHELSEDMFINPGSGGYFKGENPNVEIGELFSNWVAGADVLYIGRTGGTTVNGFVSEATLRKRIKQLLQYGNGRPVGHRGGRYLWQHKNSSDFRIYWYTCVDENPVTLEQNIRKEFLDEYNQRPFANLV